MKHLIHAVKLHKKDAKGCICACEGMDLIAGGFKNVVFYNMIFHYIRMDFYMIENAIS